MRCKVHLGNAGKGAIECGAGDSRVGAMSLVWDGNHDRQMNEPLPAKRVNPTAEDEALEAWRERMPGPGQRLRPSRGRGRA